MTDKLLTIAVPKGRTLKPLARMLEAAGFPTEELLADSRALVREAGPLRFLLLKPDDVPTYVEYGTADLGVVGRDVLDERGSDVYTPLDLGIGRCRLAVARRKDAQITTDRPRVATKYPRMALRHFEAKGQDVDIIELSGSVELAAVENLADYIVDVVETGITLAENGLTVEETVSEVSTMLIVNRAIYKLHAELVSDLVDRLARVVGP
jgi:ATP phosphoribosyltransferase